MYLLAQAGGRHKDRSSANAGHVCSTVLYSALKTSGSGCEAQRDTETNFLKVSAVKYPARIHSAIRCNVKYWCADSSNMNI